MKRFRWIMLIALMASGLTGCATIYHHATFPHAKPISFNSTVNQPQALVRTFTDTDRQFYFFFHWFPINHANGVKIAERHLEEGDAVTNLRIHTRFGLTDYVLTLLTAGIISTYTVEAHGDIVRLAVPVPPA